MSNLDLTVLAQWYGIPFDTGELVVAGVNRTYRLSDGCRHYYLGMYRPEGRSDAEIAFELSLLRGFPSTPGIDVARSIRTKRGHDLVPLAFEGAERKACLFQALEGRPFSHSTADMALFGTAIAKLHGALRSLDDGVRLLDVDVLCQECIEDLRLIPGSQQTISAIEKHCIGPAQAVGLHSLPCGNCHGDAWPANAIVQAESVGFLDFEDCGSGPYMIDLGTAARHLHYGKAGMAAVDALLSGYAVVRALEPFEKAALPFFVRFAEVRSLLFLARFCALSDDLWQHALGRAEMLFEQV